MFNNMFFHSFGRCNGKARVIVIGLTVFADHFDNQAVSKSNVNFGICCETPMHFMRC